MRNTISIWISLSAHAISQGLIVPDNVRYTSNYNTKFATPPSFTASADLPDRSFLHKGLPAPGDQRDLNKWGYSNSRNSCVGWTLGYALYTFLANTPEDPANPIYPYHWGIGWNGRPLADSGAWFGPVFNALNFHGNCGMSDYRDPLSDPRREQIDEFRKRSRPGRIIESRISRKHIVDDVRFQIAKKRTPVPCGFNIPPNFHLDAALDTVTLKDGRTTKIWRRTSDEKPVRHAMLVTGYDDDLGENGAFEALNSYGKGFGNSGYIWIDYEFFASVGVDARDALDNPCCIFAYAIELGPYSDDQAEIENQRKTTLSGKKEAWIRLQDSTGEANFVLPEGGIHAISRGERLSVSPSIEVLNLRSNVGSVRGSSAVQTAIMPQVGYISNRDVVKVSELKELSLEDGTRKEYWIKGTVMQNPHLPPDR